MGKLTAAQLENGNRLWNPLLSEKQKDTAAGRKWVEEKATAEKYSFYNKSQLTLGIVLLVSSVAFLAFSRLGMLPLSAEGVGVMSGVGFFFTARALLSMNGKTIGGINLDEEDPELNILFEEMESCCSILSQLAKIDRNNPRFEDRKKLITFKAEIEELAEKYHLEKLKRVAEDDPKLIIDDYLNMLELIFKNSKEAYNAKLSNISEPNPAMNIFSGIFIGTALLVTTVALIVFARLELILWKPQLVGMIGGTGIAVLSWALASKCYGTKEVHSRTSFENLQMHIESWIKKNQQLNNGTSEDEEERQTKTRTTGPTALSSTEINEVMRLAAEKERKRNEARMAPSTSGT